uniref:Uncharacterized protein n=1 Tax=Anopheles culicifacies TaxID=139723 RepID=A0A182M7U7_9DIPT
MDVWHSELLMHSTVQLRPLTDDTSASATDATPSTSAIVPVQQPPERTAPSHAEPVEELDAEPVVDLDAESVVELDAEPDGAEAGPSVPSSSSNIFERKILHLFCNHSLPFSLVEAPDVRSDVCTARGKVHLSGCILLEQYYLQKDRIATIVAQLGIENQLKPEDLEAVREIKLVLKLFHTAEQEIASETLVTLSQAKMMVLLMMRKLHEYKDMSNFSRDAKRFIVVLIDVFKITFSSLLKNTVTSMTTLLDPRYKNEGLENFDQYRECCGNDMRLALLLVATEAFLVPDFVQAGGEAPQVAYAGLYLKNGQLPAELHGDDYYDGDVESSAEVKGENDAREFFFKDDLELYTEVMAWQPPKQEAPAVLKVWLDVLQDEHASNVFQTPLYIFYRIFLTRQLRDYRDDSNSESEDEVLVPPRNKRRIKLKSTRC